ncbi:MAG: hypothetical protein P8J86_09855 [Phycisphaerales bacterium]|nr:hypothetical protein [Phycisphaerales bacterium]
MPDWKMLIDFKITLEHKPGAVASFAARLREADVILLGLSGHAEQESTAVFHCIPERADQFRSFLRSTDIPHEEGSVLFIGGANRGDAMIRTLEMIASANLNLVGLDAVTIEGEFGYFIWAQPQDWAKLREVLS